MGFNETQPNLIKKIISQRRGAVFIEYALGLLFVVGALMAITGGLLLAGMVRTSGTVNVQKNVAPCSDRLSALTTDYSAIPVGTPDPSATPNTGEQALCY